MYVESLLIKLNGLDLTGGVYFVELNKLVRTQSLIDTNPLSILFETQYRVGKMYKLNCFIRESGQLFIVYYIKS